MAWITISADDVKARMSSSELELLQNNQLADGQADPLPGIITSVADEVRGYVAAGGYTLGTASTIPQKLLSAAVAIIRYRIINRFPSRRLLTEERIQENKEALRLLERVSDKKFVVEEPTTADTETASGAAPSMATKTRTYDRTNQDGI
jgi:phage gp36-like protein